MWNSPAFNWVLPINLLESYDIKSKTSVVLKNDNCPKTGLVITELFPIKKIPDMAARLNWRIMCHDTDITLWLPAVKEDYVFYNIRHCKITFLYLLYWWSWRRSRWNPVSPNPAHSQCRAVDTEAVNTSCIVFHCRFRRMKPFQFRRIHFTSTVFLNGFRLL